MTHEEAYNTMMEGFLVSHKDLADDAFLFMTPNYVIHDENDNDFEESWDKLVSTERFKVDWYIYKEIKKVEQKQSKVLGIIGMRQQPQLRQIENDFVSHISGMPCPGKDKCLQYSKMIGETACVLCDVHDEERTIGTGSNPLLLDLNEDGNVVNKGVSNNTSKELLLETIPSKKSDNEKTKLKFNIKKFFRRRKK